MFRGREMQHPQLGRRILDRVADAVAHVGRVEVFPKLEGRNMSMVLVPGQATRRQREAAAEHQEAPEPDTTTEEATTEEGTTEGGTTEEATTEEATTEDGEAVTDPNPAT